MVFLGHNEQKTSHSRKRGNFSIWDQPKVLNGWFPVANCAV